MSQKNFDEEDERFNQRFILKQKVKDAIETLVQDDEDTVWDDVDTPDGAFISADKLLKLLELSDEK